MLCRHYHNRMYMKNLLQKLFDIREGEATRTLLMFFYIFAVIFCLVMLKSVRESLFLASLAVNELPIVFILVALTAAVVTTVYSRFSRKVSLNILMRSTVILIIISLVIFWLLLTFNISVQGRWFLYGFYTWVAIYGVIATSQFWILTNYVFNARQAKRLLGVVGAGAISGGIFGGYLANLAKIYGTENLLLICIGLMVVCLIILQAVWKMREHGESGDARQRKRQSQSGQASSNPFKLLKSSRHLLYLAGIVCVSVIVANLVDYQYKAMVKELITDKDERTAFFGFWLSNLSIVSLVIQLFVTGRLMRSFGVGPSLFLLPIGILFGAISILVYPELWAAIFVKVADGSLKQSVNKSGIELLALPIPSSIKPQVKSFIDVFVDSFATGIGGVLLIVMTTVFNIGIGTISYLVFGFIAIWIILIINVRREYVQAFRTAIEKRTIDLEDQVVTPQDASVFESCLKVLDGDNERQILYILNLLENVESDRFIPYLERLMGHTSADIRRQALKMATRNRSANLSSQVEALVTDKNQDVQIEAIYYLLQKARNSEQRRTILQSYLDHDDYRVRAAALLCTARISAEITELRKVFNLRERIESILKSIRELPQEGPQRRFTRVNLAKTIGEARLPELYPYLHILLNDPDALVRQQAATSAGQTRALEFVPVLIALLNDKKARMFAREALANYGEPVLEALDAYLHDLREPRQLRLNIPRVIDKIGTQKSVDTLIRNLKQDDLLIRFQVLKALNRLRKNYPMLNFEEQTIERQILDESRNYMEILTVLYAQQKAVDNGKPAANEQPRGTKVQDARKLLIKALEEKLDKNLERIFRLLGLKYTARDMFNAYLGIVSRKQDVRANAVEFLDNILDTNLKRLIIPIIESGSVETLVEIGRGEFDIDVPNEKECIKRLLKNHDDWLKACTLFLIAELKADTFLNAIGSMVNSREPIIKETAEYALRTMEMTD